MQIGVVREIKRLVRPDGTLFASITVASSAMGISNDDAPPTWTIQVDNERKLQDLGVAIGSVVNVEPGGKHIARISQQVAVPVPEECPSCKHRLYTLRREGTHDLFCAFRLCSPQHYCSLARYLDEFQVTAITFTPLMRLIHEFNFLTYSDLYQLNVTRLMAVGLSEHLALDSLARLHRCTRDVKTLGKVFFRRKRIPLITFLRALGVDISREVGESFKKDFPTFERFRDCGFDGLRILPYLDGEQCQVINALLTENGYIIKHLLDHVQPCPDLV